MMSLLNAKGKEIPEELRKNLKPHKIYLRLNEDFCMACYNPAIEIINNVNNTYKDTRIGIVGSFKSQHEYEEILKEFNDYDSIEAFNMPSMDMGQPDELQMPYLFEINENGTIESMCMLIKGEEDLIPAYLHSCSR